MRSLRSLWVNNLLRVLKSATYLDALAKRMRNNPCKIMDPQYIYSSANRMVGLRNVQKGGFSIWKISLIHHIYINCWLPVYRWSVMDKQVTSTPPPPNTWKWGGGGGSGYLYLHYWSPVGWEPAINVDMVNSTEVQWASARELLVPFFTPLEWCGPDSNQRPPASKADDCGTSWSYSYAF